MEDAVIGAVFVVCRGFRDNGDGLQIHKLREWKSMKIRLNLLWQLAVLHIIEAEKRTQRCRQQINAVIPPHEKILIVIYSKYYSVFEPYYSKVYYTVYIIVFTTLC